MGAVGVAHHRRDRGACLGYLVPHPPHLLLGRAAVERPHGGRYRYAYMPWRAFRLPVGHPRFGVGGQLPAQSGDARQLHQMIFSGSELAKEGLLKVSQPQ